LLEVHKKITLVPIGEFKVSTDPLEYLDTCIGSCVAVAVHDPSSMTAGLLHVVLPGRRTEVRANSNPYYADAGVHMLVEAMIAQGASMENMVASLVGGASMLPSKAKVGDIGTMNVEKVETILSAMEIPVILKVVGGEDGRRISFSVATGEVAIQPTFRSLSRRIKPREKSKNVFDAELLTKLERLRPSAAAADALLDEVHKSPINWISVKNILVHDVILGMQVFKMANSDYYGRQYSVGSLEQGLTRLGPDQMRRICILAATAKNQEEMPGKLSDLAELMLRNHCRASALLAMKLSKEMPENFQHEAATAALLHGVGVASSVLIGSDKAELDSAELGAYALSAWSIPEQISLAVEQHRTPPEQDQKPSLASIVHAACGISRLLGIICPGEPAGFNLSLLQLEQLSSFGPFHKGLLEVVKDFRQKGLLDYPLP